MEDLSQYTSLERYVLTRGRQLAGPTTSLKSLNVQFAIGVGLIGVSAMMAVAAVLTSSDGLRLGAVSPLIPGVINIGVASALKRRFLQSSVQDVNASPEARTMLSRLAWTFIWSKNPWTWGVQAPEPEGIACGRRRWVQHRHDYRHAWCHGMGMPSLSGVPPEVLEKMETAANQYNRVVGALEAAKPAGTIERLRSKILQAADESMLDVLHQCQLMSQFPEGAKSIQGRLAESIATLKELGDRVEALTLREPTFTDMMSRRTTADEVLEELRLEQSAFSELASQEDDGPRNHLKA